jgi:hypothetical protein
MADDMALTESGPKTKNKTKKKTKKLLFTTHFRAKPLLFGRKWFHNLLYFTELRYSITERFMGDTTHYVMWRLPG